MNLLLQSWTNICRLFPVLAQFLFTTNETELGFITKKVSVRIVSRITRRYKT